MAITPYTIEGKKLYEVYVNGFDARGRRLQWRKRGIESIRKAEEIQFNYERDLAKLREEGVPYTWDEWFKLALARMKHTLKISTVMKYDTFLGKRVTPRWKDRDLKSITRSDVFDVVMEFPGDEITLNSKKCLLKCIKRVFQMALEEGILDRNPAIGLKVNVPEIDQKVLTNEEAKTFLKEAKITQHRFYPIWALALFTGMRSGELFELRWNDIDLEARIISVKRQWTSKTGVGPTKSKRARQIPISDDLLLFLKEQKLKSQTEHVLPRLIEWENGEQAQITRGFCEMLGLTPIKFHDLRATFITNLLARGESLARVMAIVGHTQIKTTNVYLRLAGVDVKGGTDKLGYQIPADQTASVLQFVR
ncbi:MAG: site-specific integrase [Oligoflexia bacterium]|nr:site-specific integrase [Oligoflexia bacterium]